MRIGPPPLTPLYPVQPDRSEKYPKALGEAFVGKPLLQFPEVKGGLPSKGVPEGTKGERKDGLIKASAAPEGPLGTREAPGPLAGTRPDRPPKGPKVIGGFLDVTA